MPHGNGIKSRARVFYGGCKGDTKERTNPPVSETREMSAHEGSESTTSDVFPSVWDAVIIGGGIAGLSAAVYLARAQRSTLVLDSGHSMAVWARKVENYLGFPESIPGADLLVRGQKQARTMGARILAEQVVSVATTFGEFIAHTQNGEFRAHRLLIATGIFHIPPDIPGVPECLGHSMFFCKGSHQFPCNNQRFFIGQGDVLSSTNRC